LEKSAIQSVTPSRIYQWEGLGPNVVLTGTTEERMPSEQKWYALTGRVVDAKVEADGDIHIALEDASGNAVGTVSAEIPVGARFDKQCSAGRRRGFHSPSKPRTHSKFASSM
jgi:hypothetical protein